MRLHLKLASKQDPGVAKYAFREGVRSVEAGFYPNREAVHLCLSTQWGCRMGCRFCATARLPVPPGARLGLSARQLEATARALLADPANRGAVASARRVGIDFMGMGEPLANLEPLLRFMERFRLGGIAAGKPLTYRVNTVGVLDGIDRLAEADTGGARLRLYVSVHAVRRRARWIPYDRVAPLAEVLARARAFHARRPDGPVKLNYLVLPGRNDTEADARLLAGLADPRVFALRTCTFNPVPGVPWPRATGAHALRFALRVRAARAAQRLAEPALAVEVFASRGLDVEVGCGQLCGRSQAPAASPVA